MHKLDEVLQHYGIPGMKWDKRKDPWEEEGFESKADKEAFDKLVKEKNLSPSEAKELKGFVFAARKNHHSLSALAQATATAGVDAFNKISMEKAKANGKKKIDEAISYFKKHGKLPKIKGKPKSKESKVKYTNEDSINAFIKERGLKEIKIPKSDNKYAKYNSVSFNMDNPKGQKEFDKAISKMKKKLSEEKKKNDSIEKKYKQSHKKPPKKS